MTELSRGQANSHFWSQSEISVVFLRVSSASSAMGSGSFLCCSHHSRTYKSRKTQAEVSTPRSQSPRDACVRAKGGGKGDAQAHLLEDVGRDVGEGDGVIRLSDICRGAAGSRW